MNDRLSIAYWFLRYKCSLSYVPLYIYCSFQFTLYGRCILLTPEVLDAIWYKLWIFFRLFICGIMSEVLAYNISLTSTLAFFLFLRKKFLYLWNLCPIIEYQVYRLSCCRGLICTLHRLYNCSLMVLHRFTCTLKSMSNI